MESTQERTQEERQVEKGLQSWAVTCTHAERGRTSPPLDSSCQCAHTDQISWFAGTTACLLRFFFFFKYLVPQLSKQYFQFSIYLSSDKKF